mmetsp:Transcript_10650/g.17624  ORF Transcript_10650/g.17624 Transcript_10650/m.17624 type:complete len:553 (-) Transcript_10650:180-1838(-)
MSVAVVSSDNDSFASLWKEFYAKGMEVFVGVDLRVVHQQQQQQQQKLNNNTMHDEYPYNNNSHDDKVKVLLHSLTTLLLGLDDQKKAFAVSHGALELIVKCCCINNKSNNNTVTTGLRRMGLKAITSCVVRNPVGRANCRQAGVFRLLSIVLSTTSMETTASQSSSSSNDDRDDDALETLEETMNTLAAVCLGDSLNALQATILYKATIASAIQVYPKETHASLHQKLAYLQALMTQMETEQNNLLDSCYNSDDNKKTSWLFETIETAELHVLEGIQKQRCQRWREAETLYTRSLTAVTSRHIAPHTTLLNDFVATIRDNRSSTRLKQMDWHGALLDIDACLLQQQDSSAIQLSSSTTTVVRIRALHARRVDALQELGRLPEAVEALGKALLLMRGENPRRDAVLLRKMNQLQLQLQRQSSSCGNHHHQHERSSVTTKWRPPQNTTNVVLLQSWLAALTGKRSVSSSNNNDDRMIHTGETSRRDRQQQQQYDAAIIMAATAVIGMSVKSIYGTGVVQEVRKCGLTKIQIDSWLLVGGQKPTAYLMPECYSVM